MPRRPATARRLAVPAALVAAGLWSLSGCLYIPATRQFQTDGRPRPDSLVGDDADDPIRVGRTGFEEAVVALVQGVNGARPPAGPTASATFQPAASNYLVYNGWASRDGRHVAVAYALRKGTTVWLLCGSYADARYDLLMLDFDERFVVSGARTVPDYLSLAGMNRYAARGPTLRLEDGTELLPLRGTWWHDLLPEPSRRRLQQAGVLPDDAALGIGRPPGAAPAPGNPPNVPPTSAAPARPFRTPSERLGPTD